MKVLAWSLSCLVLILLASPVVLMTGCGNDMCGGCPSDSIAPYGSTIKGPEDHDYSAGPGSHCVNSLTFTVEGPAPNAGPLNGICVEVFTNGGVALSKQTGNCTNNTYAGYLRTRTDAGGTITVDFATPNLACSSGDQAFFVQVNSCTAGATWTGTWQIPCP